MKTCLALLILSTLGLRAEIEFSGFFITSKEALFSLTETEGHRSSGWLKVGQSFGDYGVVSFDREHEIITLRQGGQLRQVPLRAAKAKDGRMTIRGTLTFPNEQVEGVRTSLFFGEETVFPLQHGVTFRIKPERLPDGNILYRSKFVGLDKDGAEQTLSSPTVIAIPGLPFGIQIGDFGFSFKP